MEKEGMHFGPNGSANDFPSDVQGMGFEVGDKFVPKELSTFERDRQIVLDGPLEKVTAYPDNTDQFQLDKVNTPGNEDYGSLKGDAYSKDNTIKT